MFKFVVWKCQTIRVNKKCYRVWEKIVKIWRNFENFIDTFESFLNKNLEMLENFDKIFTVLYQYRIKFNVD